MSPNLHQVHLHIAHFFLSSPLSVSLVIVFCCRIVSKSPLCMVCFHVMSIFMYIIRRSLTMRSASQSPTESPRFKALLRMTGSKGKRPTDIKSFSHELDPRGVRSHEFFRPHNLGGFNDLEVCLLSITMSFSSLLYLFQQRRY